MYDFGQVTLTPASLGILTYELGTLTAPVSYHLGLS